VCTILTGENGSQLYANMEETLACVPANRYQVYANCTLHIRLKTNNIIFGIESSDNGHTLFLRKIYTNIEFSTVF